MSTTPDDTPVVSLPREDARAIGRAFGRMPYWPLTHSDGHLQHRVNEGTLTGEDVAAALDALARVLAGVAAGNEAVREQLRELESQRRAVRAFLGTDLGGES